MRVPGLFSDLFNVAASRPAQMTTEHGKASPARPFRQGEALVNRAPRALGACPNHFVSFAFPLLSAPVLPNQCPCLPALPAPRRFVMSKPPPPPAPPALAELRKEIDAIDE